MPQRFMKCACGKGEWHEAEKSHSRPVGKKCTACGREYDADLPARVRAFSIGNKPWGKEGRSLKFAFDPKARASIGATCPETAKAIAADGSVVFENDTHQKRVYGEWQAEKSRITEERAAEAAQNTGEFLGSGAAGVGVGTDLDEAQAATAVATAE